MSDIVTTTTIPSTTTTTTAGTAAGTAAAAAPNKEDDGGGESSRSSSTTLNNLLLAAATAGNVGELQALLGQGAEAFYQEEDKGVSALMTAAGAGHADIVQALLQAGAPWNAVDRYGRCAGQYAVDAGHQGIVDTLVSAGVRAELIFGAMERRIPEVEASAKQANGKYLAGGVRYIGPDLVDDEGRGVMMAWEGPLMEAHAKQICLGGDKDVLNVGFGLGLVDTAIQKHSPRTHTIIEAHPKVYEKMIADGWDKKPGVRILFGRWQDVIGQTGDFDGIFFDTFDDVGHLREFHAHLPRLLRPDGVYSYFNGVCPDNVFFLGVACEVVRVELERMGLEAQFHRCEVDAGGDETWGSVAFRYFEENQYFLPEVKWTKGRKKIQSTVG